MKDWEIEVCKRSPELNQRRLDLVKHLEGSLWKIQTHRKFMNKERLDNEEYKFIKNELISWGLLKREIGGMK
jgi:hypothetical protein